MLIENEFTVRTPVDELWAFLLDVERIAPCMPGAELTETVDDRNWKGKVNVKFGPVALSFAGTVAMTERDDEAHRAVLRAKGMEQKGKGAANATVTSWLEPAADGETTVKMTADITLTGATKYGIIQAPIKLSDFRGEPVVLAFFFRARTRG